jgi:hypothetical protein
MSSFGVLAHCGITTRISARSAMKSRPRCGGEIFLRLAAGSVDRESSETTVRIRVDIVSKTEERIFLWHINRGSSFLPD